MEQLHMPFSSSLYFAYIAAEAAGQFTTAVQVATPDYWALLRGPVDFEINVDIV